MTTKKKPPMDLHQPNDSVKMDREIALLVSNKLIVLRKSAYQIKVGPFNRYPDSDSWNSDMDTKKKKHFNEFLAAVLDWDKKDKAPFSGTLRG
ncbi:hypothetical protein D3Y57_14335 [Sphingomonas paeninsulae]|uniref:Uncharacterized protein n=1 Tax=Sphingomonas paeninsulae TaxID=2319844 RepID=A0A494THV1_SPHPE|nr:hypothetical protein [Sphingomonas paeninsulae]AYJ86902.1 hypothetical protein D3Y57_14335 [Sphingomonas paeninsulae]